MTVRNWTVFGLFLGVFWLILAEGNLAGLWFALPVLLLAMLIRKAMPFPLVLNRIRPGALLRFLPYFIWQSVLGGLDVTWRAFRPDLPIDPNLYRYPYRLRSEGARVFMAQMISLMPGTLACRVGEQHLSVHALTGSRDQFLRDTAQLERRVSAIFGETTEHRHDG